MNTLLRLRLNAKILLALLLFIVVAITVIFTVVMPGLIAESIVKEKNQQFEIAEQVEESISLEFSHAAKELESIANLDDLKSLDKEKVDYILDMANKTTQFYNYFFILDRNGKWISYPSHPELIGKTIPTANMHWVDSTFATGKTFYMDIVQSSINTLVSGFSTPIFSKNGTSEALLRGVIVVSDNNIALKLIKNIKIGGRGFVYIVSSKGNLLAHPQMSISTSEYSTYGYSDFLPVRNVMKGESGMIDYQYDGQIWATSYTPVGQTG
jgi:hypothetical protein